MGIVDSLSSILPKIVEHALETSPDKGNGYGIALSLSIVANIAFACAIVWLVIERKRLAAEYVKFLKRARSATGRK